MHAAKRFQLQKSTWSYITQRGKLASRPHKRRLLRVRLYSKVAAGEMQQVGAQAARFNASEIPDSAE